MSKQPFKENKNQNEQVLTRDLMCEPSKYFHRKLHKTHRHIRKSRTTYATWAQTTQHSPVIQIDQQNRKK